jgi:hypothetical protein
VEEIDRLYQDVMSHAPETDSLQAVKKSIAGDARAS